MSRRPCSRFLTCRDFSQFNSEDFLSDMRGLDWGNLLVSNDINVKVNTFNKLLLDSLNKHAPFKRVLFRHAPSPWLTTELRLAMREKDRARRAWRRRRNNVNYQHFKMLRNHVQARIRLAKCTYYQDIFSRLQKSSCIWSHLRHLGLIKIKDSSYSLPCSVDESNNFFTSDSLLRDATCVLPYQDDLHDTFDDRKFYWDYVTPLHIRRALNGIGSNSTGIDGISVVLRMISPCVMPIIEHICNFSLMQGIFPDSRKTAIICPLPKVKNPTMAKDFRPISILPAFSKVMERIVCEQMQEYLEEANLYDPYQSVYRKGYSTQFSLIRVLDDIRYASDKRMITIAVFFDLSKAFDKINHQILIDKLAFLNCSNSVVRWSASYLTERSQVVRDPIGGDFSALAFTTLDVPQGSVLGPLLFTLYISDLSTVILHCKYNIYAGNLMIYYHRDPRCINDSIYRVNDDIVNIISWSQRNRLIFNADKTKSMIMNTRRFLNAINLNSLPRIIVDGVPVNFSNNVKYLNIILTNNLSWNEHINSVIRRMRVTLYQLRQSRDLLPTKLKRKLVTTFVLPIINYCCATFTDLTAELNTQIYKALNACLRFVFAIRRDLHITPYYERLGWLKPDSRRIYLVGCFLFHIIQRQQPTMVANEFSFRTTPSNRSTRIPPDKLYIPPHRTELFKRSFRVIAATL